MPSPFRTALLAASLLTAAPAVALARPLDAHDLVALPRVSDPHLAPDASFVVYVVSTLNRTGTGRDTAILRTTTDGHGTPNTLAHGHDPALSPDGARVFFLAPAPASAPGAGGAHDQVWSVPAAGHGAPTQATTLPTDVTSFRIAPDGHTLVLSIAVIPGHETLAAIRADLAARAANHATGRLSDHLFIRHWSTWSDGTRNHLFALTLGTDFRAHGDPVPLMRGMDGDVPNKPFGDAANYAVSPDGRTVLFSVRLAGRAEPWSTNFDIWSVPINGTATPRNLTAINPAWDAGPVFSPDGAHLAWRAMKRPGFEADRFAIMLAAPDGTAAREIDAGWDRSPEQLAYAGDDGHLYAVATDDQARKIFRIDAATGTATALTGAGTAGSLDVAHTRSGDVLAYLHASTTSPPEVFVERPGQAPVQVTHADAQGLHDVAMSPEESFSFPGWNNETVHGWIVKPAGWQPGRIYPTVFLIHGGPQGSWDDDWSTRWNPEVWAGWGYGVVTVDFHGSTGYGQAFTDSISGHWGDRPLEDLQKGWTAAQKTAPWIDASRACAAGASYGGYMTYWIAGVWNTPWKCLIDHDGVFDNRIMGYATEELWFAEWENGHATVWQHPENYERFNPINHVADWRAPMLVIHSEQDFRIPVDQGIAAFTAMQLRGIPSEILTFPNENHWVLKPANSLMWHATIHDWLRRWIGPK